jgi:hypothetical protein
MALENFFIKMFFDFGPQPDVDRQVAGRGAVALLKKAKPLGPQVAVLIRAGTTTFGLGLEGVATGVKD